MRRVDPVFEVLMKNYGVSVSPSRYYAFRHRGKPARELEDACLSARIADIYEANHRCY
jgi:hypothetical protein